MNRQFTSRVLATALLGILLGIYTHQTYANWNQRGRQEFMSHQTARFDKFMNPPKPVLVTMTSATVVAFGAIGLYELTVLLFSTVLKKTRLWQGDRIPQNISS